jgi:superfamily I DNA/RNA helicase
MHARLDRGDVRLLIRTGLDWTGKYPAVAVALGTLPARQAYLDGELCGVRPDGVTSFALVQNGRRNIPFVKYGGLKFLEAAHVKDVLAILRWAENPRDAVAGLRALQLQPGIGPAARATSSSGSRRWALSPRRSRSSRRRPPHPCRGRGFAA